MIRFLTKHNREVMFTDVAGSEMCNSLVARELQSLRRGFAAYFAGTESVQT